MIRKRIEITSSTETPLKAGKTHVMPKPFSMILTPWTASAPTPGMYAGDKRSRSQSQISEHTVDSHPDTDARHLLGNQPEPHGMIDTRKKAHASQ
jgi:hypothetical protein